MEPTRYEFLHIPVWEQRLFYALVYVSLLAMFYQIYWRVRFWWQGKPIDWKPRLGKQFWSLVVGQKKVQGSRKKSGAPMHMMIFYGFLTLFLATTLLAINTYGPWHFHRGLYYLIYEMSADIMGLVFIVGLGWAMIRRVFFRPKYVAHSLEDYWGLGILLILGLTGFLLEGARMSNSPKPFDWSGPIGYSFSWLMGPVSDGAYRFIWWFHAFWVYVFFVTLPRMRIRHIVMAVLSNSTSSDQPMGELMPVSLEEATETGQIGASYAHHFSKWHLMSLDACMECGRCTEVCPAHGVGKVLNPKQVVQEVRLAMEERSPLIEKVSEEALWACTTCNACVEACPVSIRHVDMIVDIRRNLVAEGKVSGTAATMLRQVGSTAHAWGVQSSSREDWMRGLNVPLARDKKEFDVLFWVGCAGATDPGAVKTTKAVARLLNVAGADYACLGFEESCTGDPARRIGDEFTYQELAKGNHSIFERYKFKKIVSPCPHCFNTLKNEYPQLGESYEVLHHTEFLKQLIDQGKLQPALPNHGEVTFHDPCYLARVNGQADASRSLLGEQTELDGDAADLVRWTLGEPLRARRNIVEPEHHGRKTLCCGAGGGRMWMDESPVERPGDRRAKELLATGAKTVAVGCPFCKIMLDASLSQVSAEKINLVDVAEVLEAANRSSYC